MSYLKAQAIGRLTKDPELKKAGATDLCSFSIAISRKYKGENKVIFMDCKSWGAQALTVKEYCKKGQQVHVEGNLEQEEWIGQDGTSKTKFVISASTVTFLGSKEGAKQDETPAVMPMARRKNPVPDLVEPGNGQGKFLDDNDLPF